MRVSVQNRLGFDEYIDAGYGPGESIVLRYRSALNYGTTAEESSAYRAWLQKTSIQEGARIFPLLEYRGVKVCILDETSLMFTKTLKSIDGCVSTALCKLKGYERVVFESGGNTGTALTVYGQRAGLETFFFCPAENISLLNSSVFKTQRAHLISVKDSGSVKKAVRLFSERNGVQRIPESNWRYMASMFRGFFILEHMMKNGKFEWIAQTISAAFGPIGIYKVLSAFDGQLGGTPRFMGIQQGGNCPMYRAWKSDRRGGEYTGNDLRGDLLTKVMYDVTPQSYGTYEELRELLLDTMGDITTVDHSEFAAFIEYAFDGKRILDLLEEQGVVISTKNGNVLEKTGLIALGGTLKEIERGTIKPGSKVLCCLTSGVTNADHQAEPEYSIGQVEKEEEEYSNLVFGG